MVTIKANSEIEFDVDEIEKTRSGNYNFLINRNGSLERAVKFMLPGNSNSRVKKPQIIVNTPRATTRHMKIYLSESAGEKLRKKLDKKVR